MGIFDDGYTQSVIDAAKQPPAKIPAGFMDAFHATYDATRQEDLSISERQNYLDKVAQRNEQIQKVTGSAPSISIQPGELLQPGQLSTTVELARKAYNRQVGELSSRYPEVKSDADIYKEIIEDSKRIRDKRDSVLSNTTFAGKIGSFTGAMAATLSDPLVLATIPFGASSSASILRTALTEGGINMASEALIQPFVYRYKQALGSPYSASEALTNVGAAGIGGGVIGGAVRGISRGIERLRARPRLAGIDDLLEKFDRHISDPTPAESDAAHVLGDFADVMRETPFDFTPQLDDVHLKATAKALGDLEAGNPVDVQEFVMGIQPREELRSFPKTIAGPARETPATVNQSLSQFIKNSGGASIDKAGALRGEYDALFESGGRSSGAVKRMAGKSPDELAQLAHEAGFISEPDPALLAEKLREDFGGNKVMSLQSDTFERRMDLQIDREFEAWAQMAEKEYNQVADEISAKAQQVLDQGDVTIAHPDGPRSAREVLQELGQDIKAANILQKCLAGGAE
jgi:hypothetical protein